MKRFQIQRYTDFGVTPRFKIGFFDKRREKLAWKWIAIGWGYWHIQFNYGLVDYSQDPEQDYQA